MAAGMNARIGRTTLDTEDGRQKVGRDRTIGRRHRNRALDFISQLTHVAWPRESIEDVERLSCQSNTRFPESFARLPKEERAEVGNLLAPFPKRRNVNAYDAQAVEQILAELAVADPAL